MRWIPRFSLFLILLFPTGIIKGQIIQRTIFHNSGFRIYDLELPSAWSSGDSLPLVIDLHYLGGDGRDEDSLTGFSAVANAENFILCHPWGQGTNWNVGFNAPYTGGPADVDFVETVIDTIAKEFGIDRERVYAVGMGQGGFMAQRLACELGGQITAVASVGGTLTDSAAFYCQSPRPVPVMIVHGTRDSVIDHNGSPGFYLGINDLVNHWISQNNCSSAPNAGTLPDLVNEGSTINTYSYSCANQTEILHYEVVNGGFSWPGASRTLPNGGIVNQDINAAQEIWNFFSRFTISGIVNAQGKEELNSTIEIWPQPMSGTEFFVRIQGHTSFTYEIMDLQGRVLLKGSAQEGLPQKIVIENIPAGLFILNLRKGNGQVAQKTLLIR